jgi:hypothetical protein
MCSPLTGRILHLVRLFFERTDLLVRIRRRTDLLRRHRQQVRLYRSKGWKNPEIQSRKHLRLKFHCPNSRINCHLITKKLPILYSNETFANSCLFPALIKPVFCSDICFLELRMENFGKVKYILHLTSIALWSPYHPFNCQHELFLILKDIAFEHYLNAKSVYSRSVISRDQSLNHSWSDKFDREDLFWLNIAF